MPANYQTLADELTELATSATSAEHLMTMIVERLQDLLKHYNWVGFYMIDDGECGAEPMLVLGPYVGAETPHKRIPLNQGICGAAVSSAQTVVVDDVNSRSSLSRLFARNQVRDRRSHFRKRQSGR